MIALCVCLGRMGAAAPADPLHLHTPPSDDDANVLVKFDSGADPTLPIGETAYLSAHVLPGSPDPGGACACTARDSAALDGRGTSGYNPPCREPLARRRGASWLFVGIGHSVVVSTRRPPRE